MNTINVKDYSLVIQTLMEDDGGGYVAIIEELDCIGDGDTVEEAINDVYEVASDIIQLAQEDGRKIPNPKRYKDENEFSGKFTLRLPKKLHKELSREAEREECSLNTLLLHYISSGIGRSELHRVRSVKPVEVFGIQGLQQQVPVQNAFWSEDQTYSVEPVIFRREWKSVSRKNEGC